MSDFLQFKDEVINGTPRYNITDNGDGTKSIELANEVVDQGTALNKVNFDKLNTILGYNECSVTQSSTIQEVSFISVFTRNSSGNISIGRYETKAVGELNYGIGVSIQELSGDPRDLQIPSTGYPDFLSYTSSLGTTNGRLGLSYSGSETNILFTQDLKIKSIRMYTNRTGVKVTFYKDNTVVISEQALVQGQNQITFEDYMAINKIHFYAGNSNSTSLYVSIDDVKTNVLVKQNKFTSDNYSNFVNGQIVNIHTNTLMLEDVVSNTFNDIPIDTLLESNKYYELLYDEPNDRFIAHEERV